MKSAVFCVLVLFSATTLADHTVEHNADGIDLNERKADRNRADIVSLDDSDGHLAAGVALSNSLSSHQYDFDHKGLQASFGAGTFDGEVGASVGFAIKPSDESLITIQFGRSTKSDHGGSMSMNFKF